MVLTGIDGPLPCISQDEVVDVPEIALPLMPEDYQELCSTINPLACTREQAVDSYLECLLFVQNRLTSA